MPRRSSAAASSSTPVTRPKRSAPDTTSPSRPLKRSRRNYEEPDEPIPSSSNGQPLPSHDDTTIVAKPATAEMTEEELEAQLDAWQDFAADHYEMVEQLPLELHRNFRLLRELDDECTSQTNKLHGLVRGYIGQRLGAASLRDAGGDTEQEAGVVDRDATSEDAAGTVQALSAPPPPSVPDDVEINRPEDLGKPLPDGQGGLLLPAHNPDAGIEQSARLPFPDTDAALRINTKGREQNGETPSMAGKGQTRPGVLLMDIGRLAREIVRNGEEKVAVAVGAYNAVDRHIRALDSALSAHEVSMVLGLRVDTNPSTAVDNPLNLSGDPGAIHEDENGEVTIGLGGGGRRGKKGRKGRKKGQVEEVVEEPVGGVVPLEIESYPNEPTYCICQRVSYGEMVGCENEDCPYEWFHLGCLNMTAVPNGEWYCAACRPNKTGLGMGGAGTVNPKTGPARKMKKAKRW